MLEAGTCKWQHIILGFQATAHKEPAELASILKKMKSIWLTVGKTKFAETWAIVPKNDIPFGCCKITLPHRPSESWFAWKSAARRIELLNRNGVWPIWSSGGKSQL